MNILLTGITGYLGSKLASSLVKKGHTVSGLVRGSSNLDRLQVLADKITCYDVNCNLLQLHEVNKIDLIIHVATSYKSVSSYVELVESNEVFALRILEFALKLDIPFINTHTSLPSHVSPYALSKHNFLNWAKFLSNDYKNGKCINLRLEHFYGYKDGRFISYVIEQMLSGKESIDLTAGEQERDFIYINDLLDAYMTILLNLDKFPVGFNEISVGSGNLISIKQLCLLIKKLTNNNITELNFGALSYRKNELMKSCADISILQNLGWRCKYGLENGILDCLKEY